MDSVTKDTPIILKVNENIKILRVDEIINEEAWYQDDNIVTQWGYKDFGDCFNMQVGAIEGWKNIKKIVRHKIEQKYLSNKNKACYCCYRRSQFNR